MDVADPQLDPLDEDAVDQLDDRCFHIFGQHIPVVPGIDDLDRVNRAVDQGVKVVHLDDAVIAFHIGKGAHGRVAVREVVVLGIEVGRRSGLRDSSGAVVLLDRFDDVHFGGHYRVHLKTGHETNVFDYLHVGGIGHRHDEACAGPGNRDHEVLLRYIGAYVFEDGLINLVFVEVDRRDAVLLA